jgi:hypothetical protein
MLALVAGDSSSKFVGRIPAPYWERDCAKDHRERCAVLLSNVQGANTLKGLYQCNSNRATPDRRDILLPLVRNVCRPCCRICNKQGLKP